MPVETQFAPVRSGLLTIPMFQYQRAHGLSQQGVEQLSSLGRRDPYLADLAVGQ